MVKNSKYTSLVRICDVQPYIFNHIEKQKFGCASFVAFSIAVKSRNVGVKIEDSQQKQSP